MAYEFKKLSDVNVIEEMKDGLNVLVEDAGEIVKIDANSVISNEVALKSEVEALSEEIANAGGIKTVNGVEPDENGNVAIDVPVELPASAYSYFGSAPDWEFDHSTETPLSTLSATGTINNTTYQYAKISEDTPFAADFLGCKYSRYNYAVNTTSTTTVNSNDKIVYSSSGGAALINKDILVVTTAGNQVFTFGTATLSVPNCTVGLYFGIRTFYDTTEKTCEVYLTKEAFKFETNALVIPSSTVGSTKQFKITVDDSGTLSVTEVT